MNAANGKSVIVTVADDCPTCKNKDSIDLSIGAFTQIAAEAEGEVNSTLRIAVKCCHKAFTQTLFFGCLISSVDLSLTIFVVR